jgi:glutamine amidotransferase
VIAVVDYGIGNLGSVTKGFRRAGAEVELTGDPDRLRRAAALVLPGDGAFAAAMAEIVGRGLLPVLREAVERGTPLFGICIGMQLLFEESEEFGPVKGLGVLPGRVVRFAPDPQRKVPHMGWNELRVARRVPVLAGIESGAAVYFVHSYYPVPADPALAATTTTYGPEFASSVARDNVFACQFHPEKSQTAGLRILANFAALAGEIETPAAGVGA